MSKLTTIGLDLAKHVFHVVGCDARGQRVLRKRLRRAQLTAAVLFLVTLALLLAFPALTTWLPSMMYAK